MTMLEAGKGNAEILGRSDVNDLEAILAITNADVDEVIHAVKDNADAIFTWDYEKGARPALNKLYEKAKHSQWNGETDLPWELEVDLEKVVANAPRDPEERPGRSSPPASTASPLANWGEKEWGELLIKMQNWTLSPVHARRAGRPDLHGQDRRDGAVDRRQVLRRPPR